MAVGDRPDKVTDLAKMAAIMADRILEQHEAGTAIPPSQFRTLVRAGQMLLDSGAPWPPSVERIIIEVTQRIEEAQMVATEPPTGSEGDDVAARLAQEIGTAERRCGRTPDGPTSPLPPRKKGADQECALAASVADVLPPSTTRKHWSPSFQTEEFERIAAEAQYMRRLAGCVLLIAASISIAFCVFVRLG